MKAYPRLQCPRLLLREPCLDDAQGICDLLQDPCVTSALVTIPVSPPISWVERMIREGLENFERWGDLSCLILRLSDHRLIGHVELSMTPDHARAELQYWYGKACWEQGYATEAAREVVRYGFEELGLNKITARHQIGNSGCEGVLLDIGMRQEGYLWSHIRKGEVFEDVKEYGILRSEFLHPQ